MLTVRNIKELRTACKWLLNFKDMREREPILQWIEKSSSRGDEDENNLKLQLFEKLIALNIATGRSGFTDRNTGEIVDTIYDDSLPVVFKDTNFWFTGKAFYGSRKKCEEAVLARGGTALENKRPDYLMVGLFTGMLFYKDNYSNKVERALLLKTDRFIENIGVCISFDGVTPLNREFVKGYPVTIISEEHWVRHL